MSGGRMCTDPAEHRGRWAVVRYKANRSAFNGYRLTPSAYSEVKCGECGSRWRTKAKYVDELPQAPGA